MDKKRMSKRKFQEQNQEQNVESIASDRKLLRLNSFLSNKYVVAVFIGLLDILLILVINFMVNFFYMLFTAQDYSLHINYFALPITLIGSVKEILYVYLFFFLFLIVIDVIYYYRIRISFGGDSLLAGHKANERFTTIEEIKQQYKEIPDKEIEYPGKGGFIVFRYEDKMYLDVSPVNNMIIGIPRSGKGEIYVLPSIDVYSRAEIKVSMIVVDMKTELFRSSAKTLRERGYIIHFLNLENPMDSMGYNPLWIVARYWIDGKYAEAQLMANSVCYSIFNPDEARGESTYFNSSASSLLCALILANVEDCVQEDKILNERRKEMFAKKKSTI